MAQEEKKKNLKKLIPIIIIAILLILFASAALIVNHYLDRINFGSGGGTMMVDPNETENIAIPSEYGADESIKKNLSDDVLWSDKNVINVLLIGNDTKKPNYYSRSDAMILVSLNKSTKEIKMVSLLRAAYVNIPGHKNARLNQAHLLGGPELLIDTIEQNYKVKIDNYISVNFTAFREIIDVFGGIDINLSQDELTYMHKYGYLTEDHGPGKYHLNGKQALEYIRTRKIDSDRNRTQRQRTVLNILLEKVKGASLSQMLDLLDAVFPLVTTDLTKSEIISHAVNSIGYLGWPMTQDTIPHSYPSLVEVDGTEVLLLDWDETKAYIHKLLYPHLTDE